MAAVMPPKSPSSSPRLPSPPPMAEDQAGPLSPLSPPGDQSGFPAQSKPDQGASRRIRPGTKAAKMHEGPPLIELSDIDSAFQLTEHLKSLYHTYTHPPQLPTTQPITPSTASLLASVPAGTERSLWLYELCRFLVQKLNVILTSLFTDTPPCSGTTCPEMRASEWQYLCAVHDPPKSCCAIDYCCHTLDWAANTLTSPKFFPSRLSLGADSAAGHTSATQGSTRVHQERQLTNVFRRVYRIFAHAWFQHREVFWRVEGRTGLYILFKTVCDSYALIPDDNYTIPPEAEGLESKEGQGGMEQSHAQPPPVPGGILKRPSDGDSTQSQSQQADAGAATARRHRHAPSRSGSTVQTVIEENEEDDSSKALPTQPQPQPSQTDGPMPNPPQITHTKTTLHESDVPTIQTQSPSQSHDQLPTLSTNLTYSTSQPQDTTTTPFTLSTSDPPQTTAGHQAPLSHNHTSVSPTSPLAMTPAEILAAEPKGLPSRPAVPPKDPPKASTASNGPTTEQQTTQSNAQVQSQAQEPPTAPEKENNHPSELMASETAAKAALTKAEGLQAGTGAVADAEAAGKTVDD